MSRPLPPEGQWPRDLAPEGSDEASHASHAQRYLETPWAGTDRWGVGPDGADRAAALAWAACALRKLAAGDARYRAALRALFSDVRLWTTPDDPEEPEFAALHRLSAQRLDEIGQRFEAQVFTAQGLGEQLGRIGSSVAQRPAASGSDSDEESDWTHRAKNKYRGESRCDTTHRYGWADRPPTDNVIRGELRQDKVLACPAGCRDEGYLWLLAAASHAVEAPFVAAGRRACEGAGGDFRSPGPKGYMRMRAKLMRDHRNAAPPRPALNCDVVRSAWTFKDADGLRRGWEAACAAFGSPLRVKNNFTASYEDTGGYRWAAVATTAVEAAWPALHADVEAVYRMNGADPAKSLQHLAAGEGHLLSGELSHKPAELLVEVQFLLEPYLAMRKETHLWYKVLRARDAVSLCNDFKGSLR
eukprot:TRINITY_DN9338_c0_g1_i3.p1 TRINITY_DN9338_c0_g1~~TRINITY_DN9338_c0_g1_i3.p1  ORF type:complete len:436 (+),score=97.35 TRINITY_DN9338_c0_g1_i3:64-1308(+)